jgi:hypothetical protein
LTFVSCKFSLDIQCYDESRLQDQYRLDRFESEINTLFINLYLSHLTTLHLSTTYHSLTASELASLIDHTLSTSLFNQTLMSLKTEDPVLTNDQLTHLLRMPEIQDERTWRLREDLEQMLKSGEADATANTKAGANREAMVKVDSKKITTRTRKKKVKARGS